MDHVQGKGFPLIGFLFYRSHGSCGRPGYRIDCRTIKGALDELLDRIVRRELKPLHPCIMFLGSCLILFVSLRAYGHLDYKLEFIENGVHSHLL